MNSVHERFTERFRQWELRGRGWQVFDEPVYVEPPFVPFSGHYLPNEPIVDDGVRPGLLRSIFGKRLVKPPVIESQEEEPEPTPFQRSDVVEFQASLPEKLDIPKEVFEQFLSNLSLCREPIAFELLGAQGKVSAQFVAGSQDAPLLRQQLAAYFPEAFFLPQENVLETAWDTASGEEVLAVEFGLAREFMLPLASGKLDPFIGIIGALCELLRNELALFQVLFQPAHEDWPTSIVSSVTHEHGKPFFVNSPELTKAAENKVAKPLYAAVVRLLIRTNDSERLLQLGRDLAGSLRTFAHPTGNELIPLSNDDYPFVEHIQDVLCRQTRRSGMILNSDELMGFVHLPSSAVRSSVFERQLVKSKAAPNIVRQTNGLLLGTNTHAGKTIEVRLSNDQRVRHTHIIGATGTGKSTLLFNLIRQDIDHGQGVAVLDPHGDLIDKILGIIPANRIADVILVDPADSEYSIGFNILSAHSDLEKNLLASDLVSVFQRLSTSWGDQMNSVLQNAILAFLESGAKGNLADLRKFLIEPSFRNEFLKSVKDPEIVYYWQKSFPHLSGNKSIGSILTRLDAFLAQKPIRHMVSQKENKLDFAHIMDSGKIFLAKLPEGLLGKENSHLLGTLFVSKFQQIVMSRQAQQMTARRDFWIYIDEFANFITPTMAEILSGARKYRIGLTLVHHDLHQLQRSPEVASAVMAHPFTRIVFRVGDDDAKKLAEGFSYFEASDLRNLEIGQAIARVERGDFDFNLSVSLPVEADKDVSAERREEVITASRKQYGTSRTDMEAVLATSRASLPITEPQVTPQAKIAPEPTKVSEVPVPETVEIPKPIETSAVQRAPRDLGRGGAQHQTIQRRIKEAAEQLGFRSIIEKPTSDGSGSIDLLLERGEQRIACEISISTTIDHEFDNVAKCLKSGFQVAVICLEEERLKKIEAAVTGALGKESATRVSYYQPNPFIDYLKTLPRPNPTPETRHGYKIKRSIAHLSPEEQKQKDDIAIKLIAQTMKRKNV